MDTSIAEALLADQAAAMAFLSSAAYDRSTFTPDGLPRDVVTANDNLMGSGWSVLTPPVSTGAYQNGFYINGNAAAIVTVRETTIAIAIRGTDSLGDLASAGNFLGIVNQAEYFDLLRPIIDAVTQIAQNSIQYTQLLLTGHSLGGMMAQWAAAEMSAELRPELAISVMTFGSPGIDLPAAPSALVESIINFGNSEDAVFNRSVPNTDDLVRSGKDLEINLTHVENSLLDPFHEHGAALYEETVLLLNSSGWLASALSATIPPDIIVDSGDTSKDFRSALGAVDAGGLATSYLILGLDGDDVISGGYQDDILDGGSGSDRLISNGGNDIFKGGAGRDTFVLSYSTPSTGSITRVTDYDQGDNFNQTISVVEGDLIDLSGISFNGQSGLAESELIRANEDPSGAFSLLQIDPTAGGSESDWITIAQLDGIHGGNVLRIILDASQSATPVAVNSANGLVVINTVEDLQNINGNLSGHYVLGRDIDASTTLTFKSIGTIENPFTGMLDGNGHTISNLSLTVGLNQNSWGYGGLFGVIGPTGVVQDINLENLTIGGGFGIAGALAGENDGTIINSFADVSIDVASGWFGGLVGFNTGTVFQSHTSGSVVDRNPPYAAPLVGGLVGYNEGVINQSYWVGTASASGFVPGLTGYNEPFGFDPGSGRVPTSGLIIDSYALGPITTAGLVGWYNQGGLIINSYATGVGGLVGINYQGGTLRNSYWVTEGPAGAPYGIPITSAEIQSGTLPSGLDTEIWAATDGQYPTLRWQSSLRLITNNDPSGSVTIAGIATEGHLLTASNTLADADGLGTISYQWQRNTGSGFGNIAGATGGTYTLGDADVGATVLVVASYTDAQGTAESVASTATSTVNSTADFILTTGSDTVAGTTGDDTVNGTAATLNAGDRLTGGAGSDVLALYGSGTFQVDQLTIFTGFEGITLTNFTNDRATLTLGNQSIAVTGYGSGSEYVNLGSGAVTFQGGSGDNNVYSYSASNWNAGNSIDGGLYGAVNLNVSGTVDAVYDLTTNALSHIQQLLGIGDNLTVHINSAVAGGVVAYGASGTNARLLTSDAVLDLSHSTVSGFTVASSNTTGTNFIVHNLGTAFQVAGGTGSDTITAQGFAFSADQRNAIFATASVEHIVDTSGTYTAALPEPHVFSLTTGSDTVAGTTGDDTVNGTAATLNAGDRLTGGAGSDVLALYGSGTFQVDQLTIFTGFEGITLTNFTNDRATLTLGNQSIAVTGYGSGSEYVNLGSGAVTFQGGSGDNNVYSYSASNWNAGNSIDGGLYGAVNLNVSGTVDAVYDLTTNALSHIQQLLGIGDNLTVHINSAVAGGVVAYGASGTNARLLTSDAVLDLSHSTVSGFTVASSNTTGTNFIVHNLGTAFQVAGGTGSDTITAQGFAFSADQRNAIFATASVEHIVDTSGTYSSTPTDDYSASTSTTGVVAVGGSSTGNIETSGDADWFAVTLTAGTTYQFDLEGSATGQGTLAHTHLRFYDQTGSIPLDSTGHTITYTPGATGTYYLVSSAGDGVNDIGTYKLSATALSTSTPTDDYSASTSTTGVVAVGGSSTGNIETSGDADWFAVTLTAGTTYQFDLEGSATGQGTLAHTHLRFYDQTGSIPLDSTGHTITYTPGATGTYYLVSSAGDGVNDIGTYKLNATALSSSTPSGTVKINGTATEDQVLTASNTLADVDGLGTISYRWQRDTGSGFGNIAGATGDTYRLGDDDVGAKVRVVASYIDGHGTTETVASAATATVGNINDAPTGSVTIAGIAAEDQLLTALNTLGDPDGLGTISYQWQRDTGSGFGNVAGATGGTYTLGDADVGANVRVVASYTDGRGMVESVTSAATATVGNVNDAPTGSVTIAGTAAEDQLLTALNTLGDPDGLGPISYQWQRDTGSGFGNIVSATGGTYSINDADVGARVRVVASYTDGHGTAESVVSAATATVGGINHAPTGVTSDGPTHSSEQIASFIDVGLTVSDTDSSTLSTATVSFSGGFHTGQDVLAFVNSGSLMGNVIGQYNATTGVLTLTSAGATATVAEWQTALRAVTYLNTSDVPDMVLRTIAFQVSDGLDQGTTFFKSVDVSAVNDAPTQNIGADAAVLKTKDLSIADLSISDVDAGSSLITTTISVEHGTLKIIDAGSLVMAGNDTLTVTLIGTVEQINDTLGHRDNIIYRSVAGFAGSDTLTMITNDGGHNGSGGAQQDEDSKSILVFAPNQGAGADVNLTGNDPYDVTTDGTTVHTGTGNHTITLNATNTEVEGGSGHNTVIFRGDSADYTITENSDGSVTLIDRVINRDGQVNLSHVEFLQFDDKIIFVVDAQDANIVRLYFAALDRVPDFGGLGGWIDIYNQNISASVKAAGVYAALAQTENGYGTSIAGGFTHSIEFQTKYGTLDDSHFVDQLYQNVLGRNAEQTGLDGWLDLMHDGGFTREMVLVGFAASIENINKTTGWLIEI